MAGRPIWIHVFMKHSRAYI